MQRQKGTGSSRKKKRVSRSPSQILAAQIMKEKKEAAAAAAAAADAGSERGNIEPPRSSQDPTISSANRDIPKPKKLFPAAATEKTPIAEAVVGEPKAPDSPSRRTRSHDKVTNPETDGKTLTTTRHGCFWGSPQKNLTFLVFNIEIERRTQTKKDQN
jgi:hypothetical protein